MSFWQLDGTSHLHQFKREEVEELVKTVYGWNVCMRCCLRILGLKEAHLYKEDEKELAAVFKMEVKRFICVVCLDVLQIKFCCDEFLAKLELLVAEQEVQFDDFFCALSLPVSQLVRDHRLCVRLHQTFPKIFDWPDVKSNMTALKDVWKWINGARLSRLLRVPFNQKGNFEIQIFFTYKDDDKECNELNQLLGRDASRRKKMNILFNRMNMNQLLDETPIEVFKEKEGMEESKLNRVVDAGCELERVECVHQAIYVAGRYNKFRSVSSLVHHETMH